MLVKQFQHGESKLRLNTKEVELHASRGEATQTNTSILKTSMLEMQGWFRISKGLEGSLPTPLQGRTQANVTYL